MILAKTYPSPSAKHIETSAWLTSTKTGRHAPTLPVPFRLMEGENRFNKWQWIEVRIEKSNKDHRPESHNIYIDDMVCGTDDVVLPKKDWAERRKWLEKIQAFDSFTALEKASKTNGISLALLRPERVLDLEVTKARNPDWTEEEMGWCRIARFPGTDGQLVESHSSEYLESFTLIV